MSDVNDQFHYTYILVSSSDVNAWQQSFGFQNFHGGRSKEVADAGLCKLDLAAGIISLKRGGL